jgi:biotin transport system ATP-binding protein
VDFGTPGRRGGDHQVTAADGSGASALHLAGVGVRLGDVEALRDVTLDVDARTLAVIGENGSGKSTFARLVGGLVARTAGELGVLGIDPDRGSRELRRRVALVFSNPDAQIVMPTVAEDVAFSLRPERLPRAESDARVAEALRRFRIQDLAERSSHELSGGQKQLLALAGAFVRRPELVIADEPTAYLDARNARAVADHLFEDGHRLVLVTHDMAAAARCDAAVLFIGGRLVRVGGPAAVIAEYEALLA